MRIVPVLAGLCAAACGNAATDPARVAAPQQSFPVSISFENYAPVAVYITWHDGQGTTGTDTVPADTVPPASDIQTHGAVKRCERFTAHADTASWSLVLYAASETASGVLGPDTATYTTGSFNPESRPLWQMAAGWFRLGPQYPYHVQLLILGDPGTGVC